MLRGKSEEVIGEGQARELDGINISFLLAENRRLRRKNVDFLLSITPFVLG